MATRDEIKKMIARMILAFPNYRPDLQGDVNAVDVLFELLGDIPFDKLMEGTNDCIKEPGRKFAPSVGEIIHAVNELPYKGMSDVDRYCAINGIRNAHDVLEEMGLNDKK